MCPGICKRTDEDRAYFLTKSMMGVFILFKGFHGFKEDGAFHTFAEKFATIFIDAGYLAGGVICVCGATARAI